MERKLFVGRLTKQKNLHIDLEHLLKQQSLKWSLLSCHDWYGIIYDEDTKGLAIMKTICTIKHVYSVLSYSTVSSNFSLQSSWVWCHQLCTPGFRNILPFFSSDPLKLWLDGDHQCTDIFRSLKRYLTG